MGTFTSFVTCLGSEDSTLEAERLAPVWTSLRKVLRRELRRTGLWRAPPAYLGVVGWESWTETFDDHGLKRRVDALDELTEDCFVFVFIRRLQGLKAQLKTKETIDGLVLRSIRNFIYDRQRAHDPVGFHAYETLRGALARGVDAGWLEIESGDSRIRNETVFALAGGDASLASARDLEEIVSGWGAELFSAVVPARGPSRATLVQHLEARVRSLPDQGVGRFRFADLIVPFKGGVRQHWSHGLHGSLEVPSSAGDEESSPGLEAWLPGVDFEERQHFERLAACVRQRLGTLQVEASTRHRLSSLWELICLHAEGGEASGGDGLPSRRQMAAMLNIPRNRMPDLFEQIGRLVNECRQGPPAHSGLGASSAKPRGRE